MWRVNIIQFGNLLKLKTVFKHAYRLAINYKHISIMNIPGKFNKKKDKLYLLSNVISCYSLRTQANF